MLLAIDIGNTNIVIGVYDQDKLKYNWRISTVSSKTSDELGILYRQLFEYKNLPFDSISEIVISSVVPTIMPAMEDMCKEYFRIKPLIVGPGIKTGLVIKFENPKEVGADRIVNGIAAIEKYGAPVIVVDFGTATTYDAISAEGFYLGGAIAPGIGISMEALFKETAKLPRVELIKPEDIIGKTTVSCMQSGIIYGFIGQIDGIVGRMKKELGEGVMAVATGGLAPFIAVHCETIDYVDQFLTLDGLKSIYYKNVLKG